MSGQVKQAGKAIVEVYWVILGTRGGRYGCLLVGVTAKFIKCSYGIPYLHVLEVYFRSDSCGGLGRACR